MTMVFNSSFSKKMFHIPLVVGSRENIEEDVNGKTSQIMLFTCQKLKDCDVTF